MFVFIHASEPMSSSRKGCGGVKSSPVKPTPNVAEHVQLSWPTAQGNTISPPAACFAFPEIGE